MSGVGRRGASRRPIQVHVHGFHALIRCLLAARSRGAVRCVRRARQHRLGVDAQHPLARAPAARGRAGPGHAPVPRARAPGRRSAAAGRALPAEAPPARVAGRDRPDARARAVRLAEGPRFRGDRAHLGRGGGATRRRAAVPGPPRPDHAALRDLAGPAPGACGRGRGGGRHVGQAGPPVGRLGPTLDRRSARVAAGTDPLRAPRATPPALRLDPVGGPPNRDRDAARDRVRDLQAAGAGARAAGA